MKHWKIAGAALIGAALSLSNTASAQNILGSNSHGQAGVLTFGGGYGGWGGGARVDLEYQNHFGGGYRGAGFGVGLTLPLWAGFGIGAEARFIYDWQPIPNVAFLITPYVGLSAGFWSWNGYCAGGSCAGSAAFWFGPELGLELKVVLFDRLLLGFRPLGINLPFVLHNNGLNFGWGYHAAFSIGVTF
jgi:hypothetical protein